MYYTIMDIYEFSSVIYTVYATESKSQEIIAFAVNTDNIKAVTDPVDDVRLKRLLPELHERGKLVYIHTIHHYEDLLSFAASGANGFYTGLLLPKDYELYSSAA